VETPAHDAGGEIEADRGHPALDASVREFLKNYKRQK
jgi:hypothetical protein